MRSLGKALSDSDPVIRLAAIDAITAKPEPASAKMLMDALSNPDPAVRAKAATGLGALRERRAIRPLEKLLTTETDEAVKQAARDAVAAINSPAPPKPAPASQPAG
jgi:HEAT repeat protein